MNSTIPQPKLETQRLLLEAFCESDLQDILCYASHPQVAKFVPWSAHNSLDDSREFLRFIESRTCFEPGTLFYFFALRLKESGRVVGSLDFKNINPVCGQIDYALGFNYWNRGLLTEAASAQSLFA